ncbi:MAG: hypothetical protein E7A63_08835 [Clostridium butyricum]|nr:hypothetical protein [Clostridium butyricum]
MEFKLNKIDTDIRKKMQEQTKEDKVHGSSSISVKKDKKENDKNNDNNYKKNQKDDKKKFFTIDGVKYNKKELDVKGEKIERLNEENSKGRMLDTRK